MGRSARTQINRLGQCLAALRVLARSNDPHRSVLVERRIDAVLKADPFSLAHALERLPKAIHYEEVERRDGENWSIAKEYVRSLLRRIESRVQFASWEEASQAGNLALNQFLQHL